MSVIVGKKYTVFQISARDANDIVKLYHYSHKVVSNSKLHLGVFDNLENLVGALSFGYPINGNKTSGKISSTPMFELNRMVLDDNQSRNSESQAISLSIKWLRKYKPEIDWLLSFSDGKQGNVGYIYQATNWHYLGYILSDSFYILDGKYMHNISVWHKYKEKHPLRDVCTTNEILCKTFDNVSKVLSKQHIYVYPLKKKLVFNFPSQKYPKLESEIAILKTKHIRIAGKDVEIPEWESHTSEELAPIF